MAFSPKSLKQEFCQNNFTQFSAFMMLHLHAKNQKSMHQLVKQYKKLISGLFFAQKPYKTFPKKVVEVNFKHLYYCNFMQKFRTVLSANGATLAPKLQSTIFRKKGHILGSFGPKIPELLFFFQEKLCSI